MTFPYPPAPRQDVMDDYHGTAVGDPYRWLEDSDSPETQTWIAAQNQLTRDFLNVSPARDPLVQRLTELWDYEKYSIPWKRGDRYFFFKNDGLQNQSVLYTLTDLQGEAQVLLDPNRLSEDGTIALSGFAVSRNGEYLAYGLSEGGSDWVQWYVKHIPTGEDGPDHLQWVKFSGAAWTEDHQGFFYSRYDAPAPGLELAAQNYYQKLYYHRLGTPQSEDRLIYERPDQKEWGFAPGVTEDGRYLIISVWEGTRPENLLFYCDLSQPGSPVLPLIDSFHASYGVIDHDQGRFWLQTNHQAPRGKVIALDLTQLDAPVTIIPEAAETLESVGVLNGQLVAEYLKDAQSVVKLFSLDGVYQRTIQLPGIGSVGGFGGKRTDTETFYSFTSFTVPSTIYHYDLLTDTHSLFRQPALKVDLSPYVTRQVFFPSKDGTQIPMFLTHRCDWVPDRQTPVYLYGYGGFNVSLTPSFSLGNLLWLEQGGIYAVVNLRGGGEYGETWHQAGMKDQKQKVFDDFIGAAEWLIAEGYTGPQKIAIAGGSNGGLLVGACMVQRPDLFGAALPAVGVMDMLRFPQFTIGWAWCSEYGDPGKNPADFATIYAYSPLHNLREGVTYPPTLITTADHDDRVVPAHSFKFAAQLQHCHRGENPILIRIETKAGHGAGKPTAKAIEEIGDRLAFVMQVMAMDYREASPSFP